MPAINEKRELAGFTLLEMLLVVTIVGILAVLAIGSFGGITRSVKLDLATDNIVSVIKQQQGKAAAGASESVGGEDRLFCYGVWLQTGKGEDDESNQVDQQVQIVKVPYLRVGADRADVCDFRTSDVAGYAEPANFDSAADVELTGIKAGGQDLDEIYLLFKPPFAKISVRDGDSEMIAPGTVTVEIKSMNADEIQLIDFSPATGLLKKYKKSDDQK